MLFRFFLLTCFLSPSAALAQRRQPNILLIVADDVGREVLGCYAGESFKTPNIDTLAQGGKRFNHCYSMPVTVTLSAKVVRDKAIQTDQKTVRSHRFRSFAEPLAGSLMSYAPIMDQSY